MKKHYFLWPGKPLSFADPTEKEQIKMKIIVFSLLCLASVAFADDFKTVNGKEYKDT